MNSIFTSLKNRSELLKFITELIFSITGIILAIVGLKSNQINNTFVFWTLLISFCIVSIYGLFTVYNFLAVRKEANKYKKSLEAESQKFNSELSSLKTNFSSFKSESERDIKTHFDFVAKAAQYTKNLNRSFDFIIQKLYLENDSYLANIKNMRDSSSRIETTQKAEFVSMCENNILELRRHYGVDIFSLYNQFMRRIITDTKDFLQRYLEMRSFSFTVSISLKLLNSSIVDIADIDERFVFTAFRDEDAFREKDREIGKKIYKINKNTDFFTCLTSERFICNNISKDNENYLNEHENFDQYYNCVLTVPVTCGSIPNRELFGYLCCDTLNNDTNSEKKEIFDKVAANFLHSAAIVIGSFFDQANYCWDFQLSNEDEFSTFVYNTISQK